MFSRSCDARSPGRSRAAANGHHRNLSLIDVSHAKGAVQYYVPGFLNIVEEDGWAASPANNGLGRRIYGKATRNPAFEYCFSAASQ
jgi:hypothetical protein